MQPVGPGGPGGPAGPGTDGAGGGGGGGGERQGGKSVHVEDADGGQQRLEPDRK